MKRKKYKALMLDVDGTIMPTQRFAIPSKRVTQAINKASKLLHVGLATSRPYKDAKNIFNHLQLSSYSVINGGSQIIDAKSEKIVWEQPLHIKDVLTICTLIEKTIKAPFWLNNGITDMKFSKNTIPKKVFQIYVEGVGEKDAEVYMKKLSHIPTIAIHKVPSWISAKTDILIGHALATKQHGIFEIAKLLGINTHEIIGVGDGYNDFPLLMACGLKVAMGNAVPELKEIADYVAPPVEEDGVADVIEKFILNNK